MCPISRAPSASNCLEIPTSPLNSLPWLQPWLQTGLHSWETSLQQLRGAGVSFLLPSAPAASSCFELHAQLSESLYCPASCRISGQHADDSTCTSSTRSCRLRHPPSSSKATASGRRSSWGAGKLGSWSFRLQKGHCGRDNAVNYWRRLRPSTLLALLLKTSLSMSPAILIWSCTEEKEGKLQSWIVRLFNNRSTIAEMIRWTIGRDSGHR